MKNTIVFIHGMFQNPKSWDKWITYFTAKGYNCIAPAWPMHQGEPANLRSNPPAGLGDLSLKKIVEEMERVVSSLPAKPILIGHSVGGLVVQLLVAKGLAEIGVPISSVAPNAMLAFDWGFMKNSALIANPFKGNEPFYMDEESFNSSFYNTASSEESNLAWQQFATHDSRNVLRDCMGDDGKINLEGIHQPLLFVGGTEDQIIPASLNQKNAEAYTDEVSIVDFKEFAGRSHFICGQPGWEEVAEYIAGWLAAHEELQFHTQETVK